MRALRLASAALPSVTGSHCRRAAASAGGAELRQSWGSGFLSQDVEQRRRRREEIKSATASTADAHAGAALATSEDLVKAQLKKLFKDLRSKASLREAYSMHVKGQLLPKMAGAIDEEAFEHLYKEERRIYRLLRAGEVSRRRKRRRNYALLNAGYTEVEEVPEVTEADFEESWRKKSIVEDWWKSEFYGRCHRFVQESIPERHHMAARTDRLADVLASAYRSHVAEQNRPVLTQELADYENPYMMKRSVAHRVVQEFCVRNQLDERLLPRVLDRQPELNKLRSQGALPPEVLEPLAAFRGDVRWHFDARERLSQKLTAAGQALKAVVAAKGNADTVLSALEENAEVRADQVPGVHHPWRNHVGFASAVPQDVAGGIRFGQPRPALTQQIQGLRYPTLQRVAHTLPKDPKWRAQVVRTIRVLERSKHWDYASKLRAVNTMKEVYDNLRPSSEYTSQLDEKLPVNRVASHLKRKYARNVEYVKTFPKKWLKQKTHSRYRASLTAKNPLKSKEKKK